ncbi:MAG: DUF6036 family nucleotidyltransferase [Bacteroidia bacterium]
MEKFISETGTFVRKPLNVYFSGGTTAVMLGIRNTTIDIDLKFEPDGMQMYKAIQHLKENLNLNLNIELASPDNFIPPLPQWRKRSIFITQKGKVNFLHYDLCAQIISKVQRGWKQDVTDAEGFLKKIGDINMLMDLFLKVKKDFIKYPAVNVNELEKKLTHFIHAANEKK